MQRTVQDYILADNQFHANEIGTKRLDRYHAMLNSFNLQATLIVGVALNQINHDNMNAIVSDASRYCMYKSPAGGYGFAFVSATLVCVAVMLTCIAAAFYIELRTQHYALHVGVREAVAMCRAWTKTVMQLYGCGMITFVVAIFSYIWMFAGNENYIDVDDVNTSQSNADVVELDTGGYVTTCLPPSRASSRERQRQVATAFAWTVTSIFIVTLVIGLCFLWMMKVDFDRVEQELVEAQGEAKLRFGGGLDGGLGGGLGEASFNRSVPSRVAVGGSVSEAPPLNVAAPRAVASTPPLAAHISAADREEAAAGIGVIGTHTTATNTTTRA